MAVSDPNVRRPMSRRRFLKVGMVSVGALAVYAGEVERHYADVTQLEITLRGLPDAFDGMRIVQLSDIHLDEFTEPFFLQHVVDEINRMQPDAVFLTGDYVSYGPRSNDFALGAAWQCGKILKGLECKVRYAVLGNHDVIVGAEVVTAALEDNGIPVLRNACVPLERNVGDKDANGRQGRIWLAGLDDPAAGDPEPKLAIPAAIQNIPNEPVVLLCHAPDYADDLIATPEGNAVALMLSGHTHGGQVRVPLMGALQMTLPPMGRKYVEGMFRLGNMQLYVNRGIGTVGLPMRFNCPPEITLIRLRGDTA